MSLKLLCASLLLTCVTAQCPELCRCPQSVDNLVFEMHCNNASLTEVPSGDFKEVFFLDLSFNNITTLKNNTFEKNNNKNLVRLYLNNNNGFKTIEENAFRGLEQLRLLNLAQNDITTLHPNVFEVNKKLEVLDLSGNQNLKLPDDASFSLPNLDILLLKHCELQNIPQHFFKNMLNLQHIFLRGNKLSTFDPQLILPLSNLNQLDLRGNQFTSLPIDLNPKLPEKLVINFEGNPLACDCGLESIYTLNKERKLYDFMTCGTPAASTLHKFLLDKCTNKPAPLVIPTSESSTPPVTSSNTPVSISTTEEQNKEILPRDRDPTDWVSTTDGDTDSLTSLNLWWVALSAVIVAIIIISILVALIKRNKHARNYTMSRKFSSLGNEDEEQNFIL